MRPFELFKQNGDRLKAAGVWACGQCGVVHQHRDFADKCCTCQGCGKPKDRSPYSTCKACGAKAQAERDEKARQRLDQAPLAENYSGWVYLDGAGFNEGFFEDMEGLLDWLAEEDRDERPTRAWCCRQIPFPGPTISEIVERIADGDTFEGIEDRLKGTKEFCAAIVQFNEVNKDLVSYQPDYKRAVLIPAEDGPPATVQPEVAAQGGNP